MESEQENSQSPLEAAASTPVEQDAAASPEPAASVADDAAAVAAEPSAPAPEGTAPEPSDADDAAAEVAVETASVEATEGRTTETQATEAQATDEESAAPATVGEVPAGDTKAAAALGAASQEPAATPTDAGAAQGEATPSESAQQCEAAETVEVVENVTVEVTEEESEEETEPPTQEDFGAFGPGASLMFHAPDPDEIRKAAEAQAARLREAAQEREAQREAERAARGDHEDEDESGSASSKRRRRRRRGEEDMELVDDSDGSVTRVRAPRGGSEGTGPDEVVGVKGSTRLEAKRQRRRESRQFGRKRHVITEAEFLARRESVERTMLVRQKENRIQIGVLEDGILAEHFVSHTQQDSLIGNVYVGKVQNVLPSMEAAFVDIGRGRNAVLYAGEVDWDAAELGKKPRKIENALKSGDTVLVQVTKDPVGHKGARLTSQVSLPGRYLVYVPGGSMTGISRKLPDVERQRLKKILKDRLPEGAGVIVRTAAEGASETELTNDINRLRSQWEQIQEKAASTKTLAPEMLYAEPDLTIKTVRDVFNEDFTAMVVEGEQAWDNIEAYVTYVAPDLLDRLHRWTEDEDLFEHMRVEEQIHKALERKVFLPSGGSLVIDRTEAMTVVDVNTGKFTGSGGNLEETVTKNNLEAAEEIVRQLRLRDIGGIIVVDFIDMVLESNRDLVLRRLVECLGRDRTKHQVAEVTSLGLVQMTRKRMGTGLLEVFSEPCEECAGRGVVVHDHPLKGRSSAAPADHRGNRNERKRSRSGKPQGNQQQDRSRSQNRGGGSEEQENQARAEATRAALASIASASAHEDDDAAQHGSGAEDTQQGGGQNRQDSDTHGTSEAHGSGDTHGNSDHRGTSDGESEGGRRRKKRRGKRSRGRGPQGEENGNQQDSSADAGNSSEDADSSSSVTIHGEVIELPQEQSGQDRSGADGDSSESLSLDSLTAAFTEETSGDSAPSGKNRGGSGAPDSENSDGSEGKGSEDSGSRGGNSRSRSSNSRGGSRQGSRRGGRDGGSRENTGRDNGGRDTAGGDTADRSTGGRGNGAQESGADKGNRRNADAKASAATAPSGGRSDIGASDNGTSGNRTATTAQPTAETPAPARRRRGSRRAVAPAAAPGTASVTTQEYEAQKSTVSRFTAAATGSKKAVATDGQPTVVGVGVKAQDITMTRKGE
ncbi:Rne/Rng family ribonuclease [Kocuria sp. HSID17590]|uniref:Rne/Rng family ribonuclease n=2 Tax=unclassified Kocuria TaxID=2649579 RepID=UPI000F85F4C8|nr:Rne/Rng family ribonuclease [Kocuria sp. HSID17590]RUP82208.1 Rne/Rng family ribonuclease [Kocuria sp. HSID17590]